MEAIDIQPQHSAPALPDATYLSRTRAARLQLAVDDPEGETEAVAPVRLHVMSAADWDAEAAAWRAGLQASAERAGFATPEEYLAAIPSPVTSHGLRYYTPLEVASLAPTKPDWIWCPGLAAIGAITEVDGKIKAAGKTTLILAGMRCVLDGAPFLGQPTRKARVLYVTEQSRQTFVDALQIAGLGHRGDEMRILFREDFAGTPWPGIVASARQDGYEVVVFDTIGKLSGIREENSAGEWAAAMAPLQDLAASGRAVIVARHDRKGGGEVGDSGRGSSQASGDVDIILAIRRPEGNQAGNRRVIETLSRYRETPDKLVVELTPEGYVYLGTEDAVAASAAQAFVSFAIGSEFRTNGIGSDLAELADLGKRESPEVKRTQIAYALAALLERGEIVRIGEGKKGSPYRYQPKDADSFRTQTVGTERINTSVEDYPASALDGVA